jgi:hypothetical protein
MNRRRINRGSMKDIQNVASVEVDKNAELYLLLFI